MKIGSIVIHCYEFDKMLEFWQQALRYVPRDPATDDWVVLRDPDGNGPNLSLQRVPKGVQGSGVDCISTSTQITGRRKWID